MSLLLHKINITTMQAITKIMQIPTIKPTLEPDSPEPWPCDDVDSDDVGISGVYCERIKYNPLDDAIVDKYILSFPTMIYSCESVVFSLILKNSSVASSLDMIVLVMIGVDEIDGCLTSM